MNWPHPRVGIGSWYRYPHDALDLAYEAAEDWRRQCEGIERPWLCWAVDDDWCLLQQKLVIRCGWTPLVGTDGTCARPTVLPEGVFVDFNRRLRMPVMWMHFPLEFVDRFVERLAFWHSDLLPPLPIMRQVAAEFATLQPGEFLGVRDDPSVPRRIKRFIKGPRRWSRVNACRWFELIGCTTAEASRSQFEHGCGWWRYPQKHPHASDQIIRRDPHNEHGVGVWYWEKLFGGKARALRTDVNPYHYNDKASQRHGGPAGDDAKVNTAATVFKGAELRRNFDLDMLRSSLELPDADLAELSRRRSHAVAAHRPTNTAN